MSLFGPSDGNRPASAEDDMLQKGDDNAFKSCKKCRETTQCVQKLSLAGSSPNLTPLSLDYHLVPL